PPTRTPAGGGPRRGGGAAQPLRTAPPPGSPWTQGRAPPRQVRSPNGVSQIEPATPCPTASPRAGVCAVVHAAVYRDAGPATGGAVVWGESDICANIQLRTTGRPAEPPRRAVQGFRVRLAPRDTALSRSAS